MNDSVRYIVGLGEVLWDLFPSGPKFGGAPANFACSAADLSDGQYKVAIASAVGEDELGDRATTELQKRDVDTNWLQVFPLPTGQVHIALDDAGQASYRFEENTAWDNLQWNSEWQELATSTAAVCFGTLGQRSEISRATIRHFLEHTPEECLRVCDINLRPPHWDNDLLLESLSLGNVLKCNEDELPVISSLLGLKGETPDILVQLQQKYAFRLIALTLGGEGSILLNSEGEMSHEPAISADLVDTVGAGDSLTAAVVLGTLMGMELSKVHQWASRVAGYVCSRAGATPGGLPKWTEV